MVEAWWRARSARPGRQAVPVIEGGTDQHAATAGDPSIGNGAYRSAGGRRWHGRLLALGAVLLLAACSALRFGYNNADTLLAYSLDSYVELDDEQQALARAQLRRLHAWHRSTQLPDYAATVDELQRRLDSGMPLAPADVQGWNRRLNERLLAIGHQAAPELARLALTLTAPQLEHFRQKLAADNARERRWLVRIGGTPTPAERVKRTVDRAEDWLGPLTDAQVEIVQRAVAQRPGGSAAWVAERARRQQELAALLEKIRSEQPAAETAAQWLRDYFDELAEPSSPERRERAAAFRGANAALIAELVNSASDTQRATLLRKLRGYAEDFTVLAADSRGG